MEVYDILSIIGVFVLILCAIFFCFAMYHLALILRRVHQTLEEGRAALHDMRAAVMGVAKKLDVHAKLIDPLVSLARAALEARRAEKEDRKHSFPGGRG